MKILGIDTSTMTTAIGLTEDEKILGEIQVYGRISHSERLMDMLKTLLAVQNMKVDDIDLLVAGRGPGSFTGIRIGVTTIRTLAQVLKKDALGVSSLASLASQYQGVVAPIVDARRGRVYTGLYEVKDNQVTCLEKDQLIPMDDWLKEAPKGTLFTGQGLEIYREKIQEAGLLLASSRDSSLRGSSLCLYGRHQAKKGESLDYKEILPNYIRPSQAERERNHGNQTGK